MNPFSRLVHRKRRPQAPPPSRGRLATSTKPDDRHVGLPFVLDDCEVDLVRRHLPKGATTPLPPITTMHEHARASRFASVLAKQAEFLADSTGTVEPPERWELIQACRFAAEQIRDEAAKTA